MPTHYAGTPSEVRALNAYIKLVRAASTVTSRLIAKVNKETGLTITQFGVMEVLLHVGPLCQKEIAEKQLTTGGNITLVVDNLEKQGLVRRERSPEDRRHIIVSLTTKGEKLIADYFPKHAAAVAWEMGALTAKEQDTLGALTRKLGLQEGRRPGEAST